jgi:phenylglyoxylate dehydrogenase epsilon subunit
MRIVIVGNGPAAISAVQAIRETDGVCDITILTPEKERAYTPCFLGKFVAGKVDEDTLALTGDDFYEKHRVDLLCGSAVARVDVGKNAVELADGTEVGYDRLLLACGAAAVMPETPGLQGPGVAVFKSLGDAAEIRGLAESAHDAVVLGSGFVAVEIAEALVEAGVNVTMVARKQRILRRIFDAEVAGMIEEHLSANGVRIVKERDLVEVARAADGSIEAAVLSGGERLPCDLLVVAVGMRPNVQPAEGTAIAVDHGVLTDESMRTSVANVYAAGDVAEPEIGGVRKTNLIHPSAVATGRIAGRAMAGGDERMEAHLEDMNVLTLFGRSFLSAGALEGSRVLSRNVGRDGLIKVFVGDDGTVTGVELVGDVTRGGLYASLIRRRIPVDAVPGLLSPRFSYGETLRLP